MNMNDSISLAAGRIRAARHITAFTGAGISVESGIPPFRGAEGLWEQYDPRSLDISYFLAQPEASWRVIREIFYDLFRDAEPNAAHHALVRLERAGFLHAVVTQNIDSLHQAAGSGAVIEFHGNARTLRCLDCDAQAAADTKLLEILPPRCNCGGLYKPDFVFFGEQIPETARAAAFREAEIADVFLIVGTTGEVMPANMVPEDASYRGAWLIEVNKEPSLYTNRLTDQYIEGSAGEVLTALVDALCSDSRE